MAADDGPRPRKKKKKMMMPRGPREEDTPAAKRRGVLVLGGFLFCVALAWAPRAAALCVVPICVVPSRRPQQQPSRSSSRRRRIDLSPRRMTLRLGATTRPVSAALDDQDAGVVDALERKVLTRQALIDEITAPADPVALTEDADDDDIVVHAPSFLYGCLASTFLAVVGGVSYGRKLLVDRRAREELELASVAAAAAEEATRLLKEARDASLALDELESSTLPSVHVPTAYAVLAMLRVRRNADKIAELRRTAADLASMAEEALKIAEKTARLTALDLDVVDYLEQAEDAVARAVARRDLLKRECLPGRVAEISLASAERDVVDARAALNDAKQRAMDVARRVVEAKEAIVAEVLADAAAEAQASLSFPVGRPGETMNPLEAIFSAASSSSGASSSSSSGSGRSARGAASPPVLEKMGGPPPEKAEEGEYAAQQQQQQALVASGSRSGE